MKSMTVEVVCHVCGKRLRGTERAAGGFEVRNHKGLSGRPCLGARLLVHRKVARRG